MLGAQDQLDGSMERSFVMTFDGAMDSRDSLCRRDDVAGNSIGWRISW